MPAHIVTKHMPAHVITKHSISKTTVVSGAKFENFTSYFDAVLMIRDLNKL